MGAAIMFVLSLAAFAVVTPVFLCYLCHCFLHVLSDSSGGTDLVRWPDEIFTDWWWKPLYCLGMFAIGGSVGGAVLAPFFLDNPNGFLIAFAILLWFVYPLFALSPLAANNILIILYPPLLAKIARHFRAFAVVWLATLPLAAAALVLLGQTFRAGFVWAFPAAIVLAAAVLFYARAWGRLAWLVLNDRKRGKGQREAVPASSSALGVEDPWSAPEPEIPELDVEVLSDEIPTPAPPPLEEEIEDEWSPHKKPYGVVDEAQAQREWRRRRRADQPLEEGYDTTADEPPPVPVESEKYKELADREEALKARAEGRLPYEKTKRPTFRRALGKPLFGFLFYEPTIRAWVNLTGLTLVELVFAYMVYSFATFF